MLEENQLKRKIKKIKLFAMDCDGVLTDGGMYYTETGDELKKFNVKDGMGIRLLREKGYSLAIITGENSDIVTKRANKLKIENVFLGIENKLEVMEKLIEDLNISLEEVAYIGDDVNDLELLQKVGLSFTVQDAMQIIKELSDYVTIKNGGEGAVREAIEVILKYNN